jgi:glucokinase
MQSEKARIIFDNRQLISLIGHFLHSFHTIAVYNGDTGLGVVVLVYNLSFC